MTALVAVVAVGQSPVQFRSSADIVEVHATVTNAADVIARAEREAITLYTVSVGNGTRDLARLAKQTGGSYQELGKYSDLQAASRSIADELHKIEVRAQRSGVTVQARKGYAATLRPPLGPV